jgi:hypothetical protein
VKQGKHDELDFLRNLAICNSIVPVESKSEQSSIVQKQIVYKGQSPDEVALVRRRSLCVLCLLLDALD